ncbi:MAG: NUMOD3 domain-containing DNA-binding protein, partial [Methanobacterium sp.]
YNVSFGGQSGNMSGLKHSDITKLKYSENRKGKLSGDKNPMYGKKHSEESRKKMSRPNNGDNNGMFGKTHSEESRKKISEKLSGDKNPMYGKKHSEESRKKMSENAKKRNNSPTSKKVKVGELLFNSASEAAKHFNISNSLASYRCRNNFKDWSWY